MTGDNSNDFHESDFIISPSMKLGFSYLCLYPISPINQFVVMFAVDVLMPCSITRTIQIDLTCTLDCWMAVCVQHFH